MLMLLAMAFCAFKLVKQMLHVCLFLAMSMFMFMVELCSYNLNLSFLILDVFASVDICCHVSSTHGPQSWHIALCQTPKSQGLTWQVRKAGWYPRRKKIYTGSENTPHIRKGATKGRGAMKPIRGTWCKDLSIC